MKKQACIAALFLFAAAHPTIAQSTPYAISAGAGVTQFDLSGTGTATVIALGASRQLNSVFLAEASVTHARPKQQFGAITRLLMPELQLQAQVPTRVAPYIGLGAGFAGDFRSSQFGGTQWDPTFSASGGVRAWVTHAVGARGELRIRVIGSEFEGTTADWTLSAMWRP